MVDRYDTFVAKMDAIDRFNAGEIKLHNADVALTGLFNGFLRYLLDEWVDSTAIPPDVAHDMAKRAIAHLSFGLREPSRERLIVMVERGDEQIIPLLAVRWLMRNAHISVVMPHLGDEWREFAVHYRDVIAALDPKLFSFSRGDR